MSKNTFYVLDHESVLVGPMTEYDARMVAFVVNSMDGGYNVYSSEPKIPNNGTLEVGDWVATHCDLNDGD